MDILDEMKKRVDFYSKVSTVCNIIAMVFFVAPWIIALFTEDKTIGRLLIVIGWWFLFFSLTTQVQENHVKISINTEIIARLLSIIDNDEDEEETPEEDTKETMIVSPEDFERFKKGEMTKEELLGIKKAVDKVTKAKTKAS